MPSSRTGQGHTERDAEARPDSERPHGFHDRLRAIESEHRFVGRETELGALLQAWREHALAGPRLALVGGEPGIGKTRLAAHLAALVRSGGGKVLYGRSEPHLAVPVKPFAEALAELAGDATPEDLAALADTAPALARIVPAIRRAAGAAGAPAANASADPDPGGQYEVFHAAATLLALASRDAPLLLIIDDIQWADRTTALLLRYLCTSAEPIRALVLTTYRTTELDAESVAADTLLELARAPDAVNLVLEGLSREESLALAESFAGHELSAREVSGAEAIHAEAAGNPLFCTQLLRSLWEGGVIREQAGREEIRRAVETLDLPRTITETLRTRIERLGEEAAEVLAAAAVIGSEFDVALLAQVAERPPADVARALDAGLDAGLLAEAGHAGRFAFHHSLIARVAYERIGAASRGHLHRRAALALERTPTEHSGDRTGELARHWLASSPRDPQRGCMWAKLAGEQCLERFEAEAAARWFGHAIELAHPEDRPLRCELAIGLGLAQRNSGDPAFRETLLGAARLAGELGDDERLTGAALANNRGFASAPGIPDHERIAVLELALERTEGTQSAKRARLLAALAAELSFSEQWERRVELSDSALALARRMGDRRTLSQVLTARFVPIWMPETLPERLANTEENVALADQIGAPREQFGAVHWRSVALIQAGRVREAAEAIERECELAAKLGDPTALWIATHDRANLAQVAGRLDQAEDLANEAFQIAGDSGQPDALSFFGSQIANIRYDQGRLPELQELLARVVTGNPCIPAFRAVLALAYVESGLPDEARRLLSLEAESDFTEISRDVTWLAGHAIYAHVCAELDEPVAARMLYDRLAPFAAQVVYTGAGAWGDCDHALGRLAATLGGFEASVRHLEASRARSRALGAPVWAVRTSVDLARMLLRRGTTDDTRRAGELLAAAGADARALGIEPLARRADNLHSHAGARSVIGASTGVAARMRLRPEPPGADSTAAAEPSEPAAGRFDPDAPAGRALLRCEGDSWTIAHPGGTLRLRDSKGVRYLAALLTDPGIERHAVDLQSGPQAAPGNEAAGAATSELAVRAAGDEDAGAVLDKQAKRAYRERIEDLREDIDEADAFNDPERASRAREELEFVGRELAAAVGIGGRDRRAASCAERARVNVTRAIRKTVERVCELDDDLGDHLERSVRTGTFCVYDPGAEEAVEWEIAGPLAS